MIAFFALLNSRFIRFTVYSMVSLLILLAVSMVANGLSALAGGGAGLLQFPALLLLGLSFASALATHKIASVALGLGATYRHLRDNKLNARFAFFILSWGLPGVIIGATVILWVPDRLAEGVLGMFTVGLGLYSVFSPDLGIRENSKLLSTMGKLLGGLGLFSIGFLNGSITSGTGLFVTVWLVMWFGLSYATAVAYTLVLVGVFWNGVGALVLNLQTQAEWSWLPPLIAGALIGGYFGAHWSIVKGSALVKRAFEILTITVGISLVIKAFWGWGPIIQLKID